MTNLKKILVPVDFSDHASQALQFAADLAQKYDAALTPEAFRYCISRFARRSQLRVELCWTLRPLLQVSHVPSPAF